MRQTDIFVILVQFLPFQPPDNPENQNFKTENITWSYYHFTGLYHTWQSYDVCFLRYGMWRKNFFVILPFQIFCHFTSLTAQKVETKKKKNEKKKSSWDIPHNRCNCYFSVWAIFCLFTSLKAWKTKIKKKRRKLLEISSFYNGVPKIMIICYTVPEIWWVTDVIVIFHFGLFLPFYPTNSPKNQAF